MPWQRAAGSPANYARNFVAMAIQFFCTSCRQPIEIDDEFAKQAVTCPYCRKVVTAPAASEGGLSTAATVARPPESRFQGPGGLPHKPPMPPMPTVRGGNTPGWIALGCMSASLVLLAIACGGVVSFSGKIVNEIGPNPTMEQQQEYTMKEMQNWRRPLSILGVISFLVAFVGIPAAIVSLVQRREPRWPAIVSLVILPLFLCTCSLSLVSIIASAGQLQPAP